MILYLDVRNDRTTVGAVGTSDAKWSKSPGRDAGPGLARTMKVLGFGKKKPSAIVVAAGGERAVRDASWSAIRSAIAAANALAFAWGVPVTALTVRGDEKPAAIAALVRAAAKKARKGKHVLPAYDGEPNITTPKR